MQTNHWQFQLLCKCGSTMWGTSPNGEHQGLQSKPLDAAIGRVVVLKYRIDQGIRDTSRQISFEFLFIKTRPPDKLRYGFGFVI